MLRVRLEFHPDSSFPLEQNPDDLVLDQRVQIWMVTVLKVGMKVPMRSILAATVEAREFQVTIYGVVSVHVHQVRGPRPAQLGYGLDKVILRSQTSGVWATRDVDRATVAMRLR